MGKEKSFIITDYSDILGRVKRPGSYIGSEFGAKRKTARPAGVEWVIAFPDAYEIGSSHLGFQIIYHVLNEHPHSAADRVFTPWSDFADELRKTKRPLCSLEKKAPLKSFDVVGFSLAYELGYTNLLNMLDLGGIPVRSDLRGNGDPLVVAGGVCACNPEPIAPFIDVFVVGDGEEAALEISEAVREWKASGAGRDALLDKIASIDGVFVPLRHGPEKVIKARRIADLDSAPFPVRQIVSCVEAVHDRAVVEIARGCPHSCRFCQAGFIYRPLRERAPENVIELAKQVVRNTGHSDLTLLALSAGDYPAIMEVIRKLMAELRDAKTGINLPSLRAGSLSPEVVSLIKSVRKTGFTIAPEAGSERLRKVINKGISDEEIFETARIVYSSGWDLLKLYFMFGLPTETQDDLRAIGDVVRQVREVGFKAGIRPNINVGLSAFVPKPHTPFQWDAMLTVDEIRDRLSLLRSILRVPGVKLTWSDPKVSFLEGVTSRGDRSVADAIEKAWRSGASFDGWGERLNWDAWENAFRDAGIDAVSIASKKRSVDEPLPWDNIRIGASKKYLLKERERADQGEYSPGCGQAENCEQNCGGCSAAVRVKRSEKIVVGETSISPENVSANEYFRYRVTYRKLEPAHWIGHLDAARLIHQALRRAALPLRYSEGFHPAPRTRFGNPLPLGMKSYAEIFDVDLVERIEPDEIKKRLNQTLPDGLSVESAAAISLKESAPQTAAESVTYLYKAVKPEEDVFDEQKLKAFLNLETLSVKIDSKSGSRFIDVRKAVTEAKLPNAAEFALTMTCDENGVTPNPRAALGAIFGNAPDSVEITKTGARLKQNEQKQKNASALAGDKDALENKNLIEDMRVTNGK